MGLINRVAVGNLLNFYGDQPRGNWSPWFRYECLDFRGQSAALNLTNGGGKTTLAEAMLAVLSRDRTLVSKTKKKLSPASSNIWSHVQVELIRPRDVSAQGDLLSAQGNEINGEHWVFGLYGYRNDQGLNYYYFKGRLEDLPIGSAEGFTRTLTSNEAFAQARKSVPGLVNGPLEDDWRHALAYKVGLPQSTVRHMAEFQKKGGQDKSAILYEIKSRPGESYAANFFYQVLAPAIMEGVMDREGEEGEIRLEETVERSVFNTVRAKQDTQALQKDVDELAEAVSQLSSVAAAASTADEKHRLYDKTLQKVRSEVWVLGELVAKGRLPGVPLADLPGGLPGEIAPHLVVEQGRTDVRVLDRALAVLMGTEAKHVNQLAMRNQVPGLSGAQLIEIPCDLFLQGEGVRGQKPQSYSLGDAKALLNAAGKLRSGLTVEAAVAAIEDALYWFDEQADTNPCRRQLIECDADIAQSEQDEGRLEDERKTLKEQQDRLQKQQTQMETNEGLYNALIESGLFSDEELTRPARTAGQVRAEHRDADEAIIQYRTQKALLDEYREAWHVFTKTFSADSSPHEIRRQKEAAREACEQARDALVSALSQARAQAREHERTRSQHDEEHRRTERELDALTKHREAYTGFQAQFPGESPANKENELRKALASTSREILGHETEGKRAQEGVKALSDFRERLSQTQRPAEWLEHVIRRREAIVVERSALVADVADLRRQRQVLEHEHIAANRATQAALDHLQTESIPYRTLHQVVVELALDADRRRQILGVFSALLFAPVLNDAASAQRAAESLDRQGAQVPVFLHTHLVAFCRSGDIDSLNDGKLQVGTTAGVVTRSVACLLDPALVAREKADLDARIKAGEGRLSELDQEHRRITDDAPNVALARRAREALERDEPGELEALTATLEQLRARHAQLESLTSEDRIEMIRGAKEYARLGGRERDEALSAQRETLDKALDQVMQQLALIREQIAQYEADQPERDRQVAEAFPGELQTLLQGAERFYDLEGPAFYTHHEAQMKALEQTLARCDARIRYEHHFPGAQSYLDSKNRPQDAADFQRALADVARGMLDTEAAIKASRERLKALQNRRPDLRAAVESLDRAAIAALKKYRAVAQVRNDVGAVDEIALDEHPLLVASDRVSMALGENLDLDEIKRRAEQVVGELAEIEIERKAQDMRSQWNQRKHAEKELVKAAKRVAEQASGLAPTERQILNEVDSVHATKRVHDLYGRLEEQRRERTEQLQKLVSSEQESRRGVTERLSYLVEFAAADLQTLKKIAGAQRGKHASYFVVDAQVIGRDAIKRLMDGILNEIDVEEQQRRERQAKGMRAPDDEDYHESLKSLIRDRLYKSIFLEPSITYVNESIRAAGDHNEFNENLSEGQKAALSLMWTIRLAEFAIEREAKRLSSRRSQLKARDSSVNIMIIDGLFSNLSNRQLIDSSMAGIESTRGRFQLIGLIHNEHYQNDFEKFPVFIVGKREGNGRSDDQRRGWVSFDELEGTEGRMRTAQIRRIPAREDT